MAGRLRNWVKVRFIAGFFVTVPAIATSWLLDVFWDAIDTFFSPIYERLLGRRMPGLGFLTAVALILVMGRIATNMAGRRVLAWLDSRLLYRIPVAGALYLREAAHPGILAGAPDLLQGGHPGRASPKG